MITRIIGSLFLLMTCAQSCQAQSDPKTSHLEKLLLGAWKQDFRKQASGTKFMKPDKSYILIDSTKGHQLHFYPDFMTDETSPSGEKLKYRVREDSVLIIVDKYFLKIEKLTADSLVYRTLWSKWDQFNAFPGRGIRFHNHRIK